MEFKLINYNKKIKNIRKKIKDKKDFLQEQNKFYIKNIFKNNSLIEYLKITIKNKNQIILLNSRFFPLKEYFLQKIKKSCNRNIISINFLNIVQQFCIKYNIQINKILFIFFCFDYHHHIFTKITDIFLFFFNDHINTLLKNYKIVLIDIHLYNKYIFNKINQNFSTLNLFLMNNKNFDHSQFIYYYNSIITKIFNNLSINNKNKHNDNITKEFYFQNFFFNYKFNYSQILNNILSKEIFDDTNETYCLIENYVNCDTIFEHLFINFYKSLPDNNKIIYF